MTPAREDLLIDLGTEFHRSFTYIQANGVSPDLSLWKAVAVFKTYADAPGEIIFLETGAGITLGAAGSIQIQMLPAATRVLVLPRIMDWGQYPNEGTQTSPHDGNVSGKLGVWELRLSNPDNVETFTVLWGVVCFRVGPSLGFLPTPNPPPAPKTFTLSLSPETLAIDTIGSLGPGGSTGGGWQGALDRSGGYTGAVALTFTNPWAGSAFGDDFTIVFQAGGVDHVLTSDVASMTVENVPDSFYWYVTGGVDAWLARFPNNGDSSTGWALVSTDDSDNPTTTPGPAVSLLRQDAPVLGISYQTPIQVYTKTVIAEGWGSNSYSGAVSISGWDGSSPLVFTDVNEVCSTINQGDSSNNIHINPDTGDLEGYIPQDDAVSYPLYNSILVRAEGNQGTAEFTIDLIIDIWGT
jgi:hypothetical protein